MRGHAERPLRPSFLQGGHVNDLNYLDDKVNLGLSLQNFQENFV